MELIDSLEEQQSHDSLATLEERILRAVELVARLRQEKDEALRRAAEAEAQRAAFEAELESLRSERRQVRGRIEKLLAQIDQLSGA